MRYIVTGAAGFIGAEICQQLLEQGHQVLGVDCLTDYYDVSVKGERVSGLDQRPGFEFVHADLETAALEPLIDGRDAILHLAGQPGVRLSWDTHFDIYLRRNVLASQRLLEAARRAAVPRLVMASSSSVYGNLVGHPTTEDMPTRPYSPYGVTKLAMEHLCWSYAENWGLHIVALRYFTVYGPGQRPDMAMHQFIRRTLDGEPIVVFGDGTQVRDFTYVSDVAAATIAATHSDIASATVMNVAGGSQATVNDVLGLVAEHTGRTPRLQFAPVQPGDVRITGGSIDRAHRLLGWAPAMSLTDGVKNQVASLTTEWRATV